MKVIGHRGIAAMAPENTLAGFRAAARLGVPWVELDVQLTADGQPVVFHDDVLQRTTNGQGRLVTTPWSVLSQLDAGSWFKPSFQGEKIPLLTEALTAIAGLGLGLNLEIKADAGRAVRTAGLALERALEYWPGHLPPPLISSFSPEALSEAARLAPHWPRGLLIAGQWRGAVARARGLGCLSLHVHHVLLSQARIAEARAAGLLVLAYTVNSRVLATRLWGWGVQAIFSDRAHLWCGALEPC